MKKILIFGMTSSSGGMESVIINYYRRMNKIKFDFLTNCDYIAYEDEIKERGSYIYKITARSKNIFRYYKDIISFFKTHAKKYDAIWFNSCSLANIDYLIFAKIYGIKKRIVHCHSSSNLDSFIRGLVHYFNRLLLVFFATDYFTCSSQANKWFYTKNIIKNNTIKVVSNAIDTEKFKYDSTVRKKYRNDFNLDRNIVVGNVARLNKVKNHTFLLEIFDELLKIDDKFRLVLVGDGEEKDNLLNKAKTLDINDNILFLGERNDIEKLLQMFDFFVFPSLHEGLSVSLVEAQCCGLKVFASSDVISSETKMVDDNYCSISLQESPKYWAHEIYSNLNYYRKNVSSLIKNNGFDIKNEALCLEDYLNEIC